MNSTQNVMNPYTNLAAPMAGVTPDSLLPFCNYQFNDAVLQQMAKSMNFQQYSNNPPLKDESGLTFNNSVLPLPRKRPREVNSPRRCNLAFLGEDLSLEMTRQQLEVDRLISLHMEKIRREMEERRLEQSRRIIQAIQTTIGRKLREKDDQIEKIGKLNFALEERVRSLYLENQIWRDLAQSNEATAIALRSNLEQVLSQANTNDFQICSVADDAESCCSSRDEEGDEVDGSQILKWRKVEKKEATRMCRKCGVKESSVLLLPCRHLCLCTACGSDVDTCPLCNSTSDATVHVNLS